MKSKYFYFALVLSCIWGTSFNADASDPMSADMAEVSSLSGDDVGAAIGKYGARKVANKVEDNNDLDSMITGLKKERGVERTHKAQAAVRYMEDYKAKRAKYQAEAARLRARMERDNNVLFKHTPRDLKAEERAKKHHRRTKHLYHSSVKAMAKVDHLLHPHVFEDPTVKTAKKAINKAHRDEIYTVLGLDRYQLGHDYLLKMDAAVSAYETKPTAKAQESLQKSIDITKEKMKKEVKLKRMHANEKHSKHVRDLQNQKYFATKWKSTKKELDRKKAARNKFVHELNVKDKHAAWVRRKSQDEKDRKAAKVKAAKFKRKTERASKREKKAKVLRKKAYVEKQHKRKFGGQQAQLNRKLVAKSADELKAKKGVKKAKEKVSKEKANSKRISINKTYANKAKVSAAKALGKKKAALSSLASELNNKRVASAASFLRHRVTKVREVGFKIKASANRRKTYAKQYAAAKMLAKKAAAAKLKAKKAALYHKKHLSMRRRRL